MQKRSLIKLFNPGTHNHEILRLILKNGQIYNYEMSAIALNYTRRISNIREKIKLYGFDVVAIRILNTNTWMYVVRKVCGYPHLKYKHLDVCC